MKRRGARQVPLSVETLEAREVPTIGPTIDNFDNDAVHSSPAGWSSYANEPGAGFQVAGNVGFGSDNALLSSGDSRLSARTWLTSAYGKDSQVQADVFLSGNVPVQLFARGANLTTTTPTYYAVTITNGMEVDLVRVNDGQSTVLSTVVSNSYMTNKWVRVSFAVQGSQLCVQVFRTDTAQYLGTDDSWHSSPTAAISLSDSTITNAGRVGVSRPSGMAGAAYIDNFVYNSSPSTAFPASLIEQNFSTTPNGGLPADWSSYTNIVNQSFGKTGTSSVQAGAAVVSVNGSTGLVARAWSNTVLPADTQVSASLYLNNLVPAQVFGRGQNLATDSPDYYAVSITRGANVQLIKVVDGATTVLGSVTTDAWLNEQWIQATLSIVGTSQKVQIYRTDSGQYLAANGQWQTTPTWAIETTDSSILGPGEAGIGRGAGYSGQVSFDNFFVTSVAGSTAGASGSTLLNNFNSTPIGALPAGWSSWTHDGRGNFQIAAPAPPSSSNGFASNGASDVAARAWLATTTFGDVQLSASVYTDGLVPAQLFVRGSNLNSESPSYYAVSIKRGLDVQLLKVVNGVSTVLATLDTRAYLSNAWITVGIQAVAGTLEVVINRQDTGQYLTASGTWQTGQTTALTATDGALSSGYVGVNRPASYTGRVLFSNLSLVNLASSPNQGGLSNPGSTPPVTSSGSTDSSGNAQHYPYIRVAELAYYGTPIGNNELNLLSNSVDLVVANPVYLGQINSVAPNTPGLIYTNVSNIYGNLLQSWMAYAAAHGIDPNSAFYHVTTPTPFYGSSASSIPVSQFWSVQVGSSASGWTNFTSNANASAQNFQLGSAGQSLVVGYPEPFNVINFTFSQRASNGWSGVLEYATAVDAAGKPTGWTTLKTLSNTTDGFTRNGQITFDPPANWQISAINGSGPLYYLRIRTVGGGMPPTVNRIQGDDYVHANGGSSGVIPVFDYAADKNHDGYLDASEYKVAVAAGDYARFAYQSALFYPSYGQMRFATNVSNASFEQWAIQYSYNYLSQNPLADGLFVDNSIAKLSISSGSVKENISSYSVDYGNLLAAIDKKIAPRWVLANTAGAGAAANTLIANGVSWLEEAGLRPLASSTAQFQDEANLIASRLALSQGHGYAVLDTLPQGGAPTDSRTQIAELSEYYMVADPKQTFIMFNGGYAPATAWSQHWTNAVKFNVGKPLGAMTTFATGLDPSNHALTYTVFERKYQNAIVLYKPLSYGNGRSGTLSDSTATTQYLGGNYRQVNADGTLGPIIDRITLRNGEGAILARA